MLTEQGIRDWFTIMNSNAVEKGMKGREVTDDWMAMAWPIFNGFDLKTEGVSKEDLLETIYDVDITI